MPAEDAMLLDSDMREKSSGEPDREPQISAWGWSFPTTNLS